jgi:hypothetical protein
MDLRRVPRRWITVLVTFVAFAIVFGDWASYEYGSATPSHRAQAPPASAPTSTSVPAVASNLGTGAIHSRDSSFTTPTTRLPRAGAPVTTRVTTTTRPKSSEPADTTHVTTTTRPQASKPAHNTNVTTTTRPRVSKPAHKTSVTTTTRPPASKPTTTTSTTTTTTSTTTTTTTSTTTTTTIPERATRTLISAGLQQTDEILAEAGTYCVTCTTRTEPSGGQESISLVVANSGAILATWTTTTTSKTVSIEWSFTTSPTGVGFDIVANPVGGVVWSGPTSVLVPLSDVIDNDIGIGASFSGSPGFAASHSAIVAVKV